MALRFGQAVARATGSSSPQTTGSITITIEERILVLLLKTVGGSDRTGGAPTFAGLTMSQANSTQKAATNPEAGCELWYLLDPPTGANTASIPNTGTATLFFTLATAKASESHNGHVALDGSNGGNNTSTNPTPGAVVCTTENTIGFAITAGGWTTFTVANGVSPQGTAIATTDDGTHGGGEQYMVNTTPGSFTLGWTFATSDDWGAVAAFFRETTPPVMENYKAVDCVSAGVISVGEKIR